MKFKRHLELERGKLDIAPLIDVIFLLLIFFMLTSSFIEEPSIKINLPKVVTAGKVSPSLKIITITYDNKLFLNKTEVEREELKYILKKAKSDRILIRSDRGADFGRVVEVWDICRELGIEKIDIATQGKR